MTMDLRITQRIFNIWSEFHPNPSNRLAIIGGPITSDDNLLYKMKNVDLSINGVGEFALVALFQKNLSIIKQNLKASKDPKWKFDLFSSIPGASFKQLNKISSNPKISPTENKWFATTSGFPHKLKSYKDYKTARIFVETLRGCSNFRRTGLKIKDTELCMNNQCNICRKENFKTQMNCPIQIPPGCGFCSTINEFGHPKSRDISTLITEIKTLIEMGVTRIVLGGPGFLDFHREDLIPGSLINPSFPEPNYESLELFINQLVSMDKIKNHEVQLFIENVKASLCTNRALDIIAKIPKAIFSIGCETGSKEFSNLLGRPGSPDQTFDAVSRAIERGIRIHVYFIHSLPGDNEKYTKETLELLNKFSNLGIDKITIYKYQELPGSPFYQISRSLIHFNKKTIKNFNKIKRFVINYNRSQKQKMLGKIVKVFLSEANMLNPKDAIGWILEGGPKITVKNAAKYIGNFYDVQISSVISDRLVEGTIIN
ncbi:radical SAM protein [Promethearchaeum syntrophicum]|uniref:Radical SAM protein n=1 Tax=Promethearchaeum syntrophicum TaxID=2594042 RepID=A0A5B9D752_9ARCH|nr:radical SAM protein [Candidatus Prometheoarchaeum syntrophicum]QEE14964.1 (Dimethylallyl)adenosine tRNA methylthiotransferase MiaB [Candidatus Prometheoarchaeum syntrophicum]